MAENQPGEPVRSDGDGTLDPSSLKGLTIALGIQPADPAHAPLLGRDIGG